MTDVKTETRLWEEIDRLKAERSHHEDTIAALRDQVAALQEHNSELEADNDDLRDNLADAAHTMADLTKERDEARKIVVEGLIVDQHLLSAEPLDNIRWRQAARFWGGAVATHLYPEGSDTQ